MLSVAIQWSCVLLLLPCTAGASTTLNYAVAIPAQLFYPSSETVCLQVNRASGVPFQVVVTLQTKARNQTLIVRSISQPSFFDCASFQVPAPAKGSDEVATVEVTGLGAGSVFQERQKVLVKLVAKRTFIQTDKPMYKPGQTVKSRIVTLDQNFIASNEPHGLVELKDPKGNRIGQWLNVTPTQGIIDLSFPLAAEALIGEYTINLPGLRNTFRVEEYVPPKFSLVIQMPPVVTILEEQFQFQACGTYTYGKPVHGRVRASVCRRWIHYGGYSLKTKADICQEFSGQTNPDGCFAAMVDTRIYNLTLYNNYHFSLEVVAFLKESGTGVEFNTTQSCRVSSAITSLQFLDKNIYYQPGAPYYGRLELRSAAGTPLKNKEVHLSVHVSNKEETQTYLTDSAGVASFTLDTSTWTDGATVSLKAKSTLEIPRRSFTKVIPSYGTDILSLEAFYSSSNSSVRIHPVQGMLPCGEEQQVTVSYRLFVTELEDGAAQVEFYHLVLARGSLIHYGQKTVLLDAQLAHYQGTFNVSLPINAMSPSATMLVYTAFPEGRVAADSTTLKVSECFRNNVNLGFSEKMALPGSAVHLQVQAAPGSMCSIRAVDQSILLMRQEAELSRASVYRLFSYPKEYPDAIRDPYSDPCINYQRRKRSPGVSASPGTSTAVDQTTMAPTMLPPKVISSFMQRDYPTYSYPVSLPDLHEVLKNIGLKFLTNLQIKSPVECRSEDHYYLDFPVSEFDYEGMDEKSYVVTSMGSAEKEEAASPSNEPEISEAGGEAMQPRSWFPETFIWSLVPINDSGVAELPVTVPDTITDWKAMTFCTSEYSGLGISETVSLRVFKPFFVEPALPYSAVRGESFPLTVKVFSYLKQCMVIQLSVMDSGDFEFVQSNVKFTACLCPDLAKTFFWDVKATKLGEVNFTITANATEQEGVCTEHVAVMPETGGKDIVIKPLLVKAEGLLEENTHTSLLCPKGEPVSETITLALPENVVQGSERAYVSFLGDIMGSALQNLDRLLQMSSGCGEQNMVRFAPNVFITRYLEDTGQLTLKTKQKAVGYLKSGYQRQLRYKHIDGSYSAFGEGSGPGNTWLTALVLKTFSQAQHFIPIDEKNIKDAASALATSQAPSGCFKSMGKLFNNGLMGAVEEGLGLSSAIISALIHSGMPHSDPVLRKALKCIKDLVTAEAGGSNLYSQALAAKAFALARDKAMRQIILKRLDKAAIVSDDQIYWTQELKQKESSSYWYRAPSVEVELTSTILMAHLLKPSLSSADIIRASKIVAWLTRQQNPYGGFASTQDTMVALEALAMYATKTFRKDGPDLRVSISSTGFRHRIRINNANRLLLQTLDLPAIPGSYTVQTQGRGCLFMQTTLRYHIPPPWSDLTFALSVQTECTQPNATLFPVTIRTRYTGNRVSTNMVLIEVKMLSGYSPTADSLEELKKRPLVKKVEREVDQVTLYLDELTRDPQDYTFMVQQDIPVKDLRPANVKIYDYYMPDESTVMEYSAPCL
ncbi:alpha-2-macroglobulin-like protein 1 isoform X1 [Alligator mississippiensis]|uniref:Ovostatin isoform A n=1 Tax=Alligator mississippiensis TaxID=8496 RepID=A0A151P6J7_ALLMI|nr:alpha-2-macroglobulin-like protein 1 isoform X1 [Alligator mississippiensis]XP_014456234.1 alpha-2-macroglobulin-like protein 1 isoform X1 [Alligator mississippiensis]XP_019337827.1 alpha-2-macroglobulin-like protein 1 isoform X1 [Alligator mississippiensis]KYO44643.1 ovostatin precursor isoform A [Alligator mississippiensis]